MALGVYTYFVTIVISNFHCTPRSSCLHIRCHQVFTRSQSRPFVSTVRDCEVTDTTLTNILKRTFGLKLHLRSFEGFLKILLQCYTINMAATEDKQLSYGWLRFRPSLLQFLNTPKWFLFFLSQYFFTQSIIVNGVYPGSISTIERRFGYSSYMIGMMTSSYDIAAMIITPLISYIGGSRKKPLFCAWGLFAMGVGFFIFMLPHFVSPPYDATAIITNSNTSITDIRVTDVGLCWANRTDQLRKNQCKEETAGGNTLYYALFVLGMVVAGAGCTPMYALGIPYMDENVKAKVTPMYVGIFVASGILGAAVGFVLISRFLLMFVEPGVQTSLTIQDKRWVGNWWIGFAIFGAICVFWSIWILGFPKEFPLTKKRRELDISATNTATSAASKEDSDNNHESIPKDDIGYSRLKDLPKATKLVFSSLPFLFVTVGACLESFVVAITGAFLPKVIETQFYQPPARAALLYGLVAVPSAFCGNIFGAYINKRLKLNMTDSARMCFIVALLGLVSCGAFLLRCNTPSIAGVNALYSNSSDPHQLSVPCNQACNCGKMDYTPVCDGPLNYFSPCHAGCNRINTTTKGSFYSNCACAAKSGGSARQVKKGNCYIDCGLKFLLFMVAVTLTPLLTFMNNTPGLVVTLRSVPPGQQSYALGLQMDLARVLGAIPGPIIFGALLDKTCILWSSRCGHRGFCLEYDHDGLAQVLVAVMAVCKLITATSFFLCWFFCQREKNTADKNTKENDEESFCCHETSV